MKYKYLLLISLIISGCAFNLESYPIICRDKKTHIYNKEIIFESMKNDFILYCQKHYKWEQVKRIYTNDGIKYIIKGNK